MGENKPKVIVIPAAPKNTGTAEQRQLRVAAYCRVSTKEEDQLNSYEAQKNYYTDTAIMKWDEYQIRALVESVRILSNDEILVRLKSGIEKIERLQK